MGRLLLIYRLAAADLRRHPAQTGLLLLVLAPALAALTLGLVLHGMTDRPFGQTRTATAGPDVVASSLGYTASGEQPATALRHLMALAQAPGVTAHSGPYPVAWPVLRAHGEAASAMAEGRDRAPAAVDRPRILQGSWVRGGGVVVERAFADALGIQVGDHLTLAGRPLRVVGIAVTAAVPVYSSVCFYGGGCSGPPGRPPSFGTGLVWVTRAAARSLATRGNPLTWYLNLRLANPAAAPAFAAEHQPPPGVTTPPLTAWQSLRQAAGTLVTQEQQVLAPASWLLALLAAASIALVTGARLAGQEQRTGLLKAAGGTPLLAAAILLAEQVSVALAAAGAGLAAGWLAAPLLADPGAALVGSPGAPPFTLRTVLLVAAAAVTIAVAAAPVPAIRAARITALTALAGAARPPRRWGWLVLLSAWLPVPLLLGVRLMTRRPRRALLNAASFAVTATAIVAVLTYHATVSLDSAGAGRLAGPPDPGNARVSAVLLVITVVLAILAAANTLFTTWATVLDSRRAAGVARSAGATPWQITAALAAAQLLPALAGSLAGIPAGTALYAAVQHGGPQGSPPAWWLAAMVTGILLAAGGLTAVPARASAARPVAGLLSG